MRPISKSAFLLLWLIVPGIEARANSKIELTGFVLPTLSFSSGGIESFSQPNASAYTAAGNPILAQHADRARSTFQLAQSRLGIKVSPGPTLDGAIEVDFIDFSKASPTTAALPRLRRAIIEYRANESLTFKIGQDWDLTSPLGPHTYNLVGHYFESGDIGFVRPQVVALVKQGPWEHGIAVGLPAANNTAADGSIELGLIPTLAWRETYSFEAGRIGFSALATSLRLSNAGDDRALAGALTLFGTMKFGDTEFRAESYLGQNCANLGLLGLGFGNPTIPRAQEFGIYATARHSLTPSVALIAGVGYAKILNPTAMLASYAPSHALAGTGPGIESNFTARVGGEWSPESSFIIFGEIAGLFTRHHLAPADVGTDPSRSAVVTQVGTMLSF